MTLFDWEQQVRPHLDLIRSGASMTARHARALPSRPEWLTLAQAELAEARKALEEALGSVIAAEAIYEAKPLETA